MQLSSQDRVSKPKKKKAFSVHLGQCATGESICWGISVGRFTALVAALGLSIGSAQAADLAPDGSYSYKDGPGNYWVVTVGAYGGAEPSFPGAKAYTFAFRPVVDFHAAGEKEWLSLPNDAFSLTLYQTGNFRAGLSGNYIQNRNHSDESGISGLRDINYTLQAGGFAEYYPAPFLRTRVELLQGFTGSDGLTANLLADYIYRPSYNWIFTIGPRLQFANAQYTSTFFSVSASESAATGLPTYRASGGLNWAGGDATVKYRWSDAITLGAFVEADRFVGDAANSPIVKLRGSEEQLTVGVGATYTFDYRR